MSPVLRVAVFPVLGGVDMGQGLQRPSFGGCYSWLSSPLSPRLFMAVDRQLFVDVVPSAGFAG